MKKKEKEEYKREEVNKKDGSFGGNFEGKNRKERCIVRNVIEKFDK